MDHGVHFTTISPVNLSYPVANCSWGLTHTHTQPLYGSVDFVRDNPGELIPEETFTHSHLSWSSNIPLYFHHLLQSMASSLINPCALQSFSTISLQVFFVLPLGLTPSTSYSIHFFTQSLSSFRSTCPYHRNLVAVVLRLCQLNPCFWGLIVTNIHMARYISRCLVGNHSLIL